MLACASATDESRHSRRACVKPRSRSTSSGRAYVRAHARAHVRARAGEAALRIPPARQRHPAACSQIIAGVACNEISPARLRPPRAVRRSLAVMNGRSRQLMAATSVRDSDVRASRRPTPRAAAGVVSNGGGLISGVPLARARSVAFRRLGSARCASLGVLIAK